MQGKLKQLEMIAACLAVLLTNCPAQAEQDNLGSSFGIPNSSPGVFWPRGSSVESLGFGRLYPNGPEFGLSTTAGGFGVSGSGRQTGVGLAERSVSPLVQEQLERPYAETQRLVDAFGRENATAQTLFSQALSRSFRAEIQSGAAARTGDLAGNQLGKPYELLSPDSVLQDRAASPDAILKTGL